MAVNRLPVVMNKKIGTCAKAYCLFVVQPKKYGTIFRYSTEEPEKRGYLLGQENEHVNYQITQPYYPTIKVENVTNKRLTVSLKVSLSTDESGLQQHPHSLILKDGQNPDAFNFAFELDSNSSKQHSIKCSIQAAEKNVFIDELIKRIKDRRLSERVNHGEQLNIGEVYSFLTPQSSRQEESCATRKTGKKEMITAREKKLKKEARRLAKSIDFDKCYLRVQLRYTYMDENGNLVIEECQPVVSDVINNAKNASGKVLTLEALSRDSCPVDGGCELWILGSFDPKEVHVQFFEFNEQKEQRIIEASALIVDDKKVLRVEVPKYHDPNIKEIKTAYVRLVRKNDKDSVSTTCLKFLYTPRCNKCIVSMNSKRKSTETSPVDGTNKKSKHDETKFSSNTKLYKQTNVSQTSTISKHLLNQTKTATSQTTLVQNGINHKTLSTVDPTQIQDIYRTHSTATLVSTKNNVKAPLLYQVTAPINTKNRESSNNNNLPPVVNSNPSLTTNNNTLKLPYALRHISSQAPTTSINTQTWNFTSGSSSQALTTSTTEHNIHTSTPLDSSNYSQTLASNDGNSRTSEFLNPTSSEERGISNVITNLQDQPLPDANHSQKLTSESVGNYINTLDEQPKLFTKSFLDNNFPAPSSSAAKQTTTIDNSILQTPIFQMCQMMYDPSDQFINQTRPQPTPVTSSSYQGSIHASLPSSTYLHPSVISNGYQEIINNNQVAVDPIYSQKSQASIISNQVDVNPNHQASVTSNGINVHSLAEPLTKSFLFHLDKCE